jgi:hypothetical protein
MVITQKSGFNVGIVWYDISRKKVSRKGLPTNHSQEGLTNPLHRIAARWRFGMNPKVSVGAANGDWDR